MTVLSFFFTASLFDVSAKKEREKRIYWAGFLSYFTHKQKLKLDPRKIHIQRMLSALSAACGATASGKILTETIVRGPLCFRTEFYRHKKMFFQASLVQSALSEYIKNTLQVQSVWRIRSGRSSYKSQSAGTALSFAPFTPGGALTPDLIPPGYFWAGEIFFQLIAYAS